MRTVSKALHQAVKCGLALFFCAISLTTAHADIWGFIDEKGVGHFASSRLDDRYELFSKEAHASKAPASQLGSDPNFRCAEQLGSAPNCLPQLLPKVSLSPKLAAFFESNSTLKAVRPYLQTTAQKFNLDVELLQALITAESGFNVQAISPKGALGLMQLMPATAARYGVPADKKPHTGITQQQKLFDAQTNIAAGSRYLRDLLNLFQGKLDLALAAYNAGEGAVQRAGNKIPNYPETQNYVRTVTQIYHALKPPAPVAPEPDPLLTPEPKRPASPDPLRPIRGRGNGLPISLHTDRDPPTLANNPFVALRHFPYFAGANKDNAAPDWQRQIITLFPRYAVGGMSRSDRGVLQGALNSKDFS